MTNIVVLKIILERTLIVRLC